MSCSISMEISTTSWRSYYIFWSKFGWTSPLVWNQRTFRVVHAVFIFYFLFNLIFKLNFAICKSMLYHMYTPMINGNKQWNMICMIIFLWTVASFWWFCMNVPYNVQTKLFLWLLHFYLWFLYIDKDIEFQSMDNKHPALNSYIVIIHINCEKHFHIKTKTS